MRSACADGRLLRRCDAVLRLCALVCDGWELWLVADFALAPFFEGLLELCVFELDVFL
jgi:hypothetical protein